MNSMGKIWILVVATVALAGCVGESESSGAGGDAPATVATSTSSASSSASTGTGGAAYTGCASFQWDADGDPSNGCEVDAYTDPLNCGRVGTVCADVLPHETATCSRGYCVPGDCSSPDWIDCDGLHVTGCEVHPSDDRNNCGGCGVTCGATQACVAGACAAK